MAGLIKHEEGHPPAKRQLHAELQDAGEAGRLTGRNVCGSRAPVLCSPITTQWPSASMRLAKPMMCVTFDAVSCADTRMNSVVHAHYFL